MSHRFQESAAKVRRLAAVMSSLSGGGGKRQSTPTQDEPSEPEKKTRSFKNVTNEIRLKQKTMSAFADEIRPPAEFLPVFRTKSEREADEKKVETAEDEKNNILKDLPEMDDDEIVEFVSTELTGRFLNSKIFRRGIMAVIITNSIMIAIETNKNWERQYSHIFTVLDQCMMTVFVCEILTKWYHGFMKFWTQGWNILDFCIVASLLFGPLFLNESSGSRGVLRILRVLRAFRSLRSMSSLPGLQVVVQTILQSVPDMANIVLLLVIIMLVFSVIGITLFRDVVPKHFGSLSSAMFALFICLTQDGWVDIFKDFEKIGIASFAGGGIYLIVFIAIGAFIFANLVVAVVVTNLECAVLDVRKEEEEHAKKHELKGIAEKEDEKIAKMISDQDIPSNVFRRQEPLFLPDFTNLSADKFENYVLIISAMEDNYYEYMKMKEKLAKIFDEVAAINESVQAQLLMSGEQSLTGRRSSSISNPRPVGRAMSGDIASGLMTMEENKVFSSRNWSLSALINQSAESYAHNKYQRKKDKKRQSTAKGP